MAAELKSSEHRDYFNNRNAIGLLAHHYGYPPVAARKLIAEARKYLDRFFRSIRFQDLSSFSPERFLAVEELIETTFEGSTVRLKLDLAHRSEDGTIINVTDWKTGGKSADLFQLDVYRLFSSKIWGSTSVVSEAYYLKSEASDTSVRPLKEIEQEMRDSIVRLKSVLADPINDVPLEIERFPMNVSSACNFCPYRALCHPNQARVGSYPPFTREAVFPALDVPKSKDAEKIRQKEWVQITNGPLFTLAGPGTGKTEAAAAKVSYLLKTKNISAEKIICLTFTNAAVEEIQMRLKKEGIERGDQPRSCTLHSFLFSVAELVFPYGPYPNDFTRHDMKDRLSPDTIVKHDVMKLLKIKSQQYDAELNRLNELRQAGQGSVSIEFQTAFDRVLAAYRAVDWGHVAFFALQAISKDPELFIRQEKDFAYVIGDEFQDFSPVEQDFIESFTSIERKGLFIFADDDQTIYGSKHCTPARLRKWMTAFGKTGVFHLTRSSRCHEHIAGAAVRLIEKNSDRIKKPGIQATHQGTGILKLKKCYGSRDERERVVASVLALTALPSWWKEDDFGILIIPKIRALAIAISKDLSAAGIDHELAMSEPDLGFGALCSLLIASVDLENGIALRRAISFLVGVETEKKMRRLMSSAISLAVTREVPFVSVLKEQRTKNSELDIALSTLESWATIGEHSNLISSVVERMKVASERKSASFSALVAVLSQLEGAPSSDSIFAAIDKANRETIGTPKRIRVCTTYSSKGLGAQFVFLPGFEENYWRPKKGETMETVRRLLYVALTRAREGVFITWVPARSNISEKNAGRTDELKGSDEGVTDQLQTFSVSGLYSEIGFDNEQDAILPRNL